jgi:class 3 adenylate cyclase
MTEGRPSRIERRLAAIFAADVAGYSRLMGLDEAGTARILREHRVAADALVAKHGGRIVKTTGDGVLVQFLSVVDAIECAVAVQSVMAERNEGVAPDRRMLFRIGINLGDVPSAWPKIRRTISFVSVWRVSAGNACHCGVCAAA